MAAGPEPLEINNGFFRHIVFEDPDWDFRSFDVDLHTRKDKDPVSGWDRLFKVLGKDISSGRCGIMLHHQKMNAVAFDFLEILLKTLKGCTNIRLVNFKDLV